jgi:multiple sugar transport system ATP-binding protein
MNIGDFQVVDGEAKLGKQHIPLSRATLDALTEEDKGHITLGFRPEALEMTTEGSERAFPVSVNLVEELGSDAFVYGQLAESEIAEHITNVGAGEAQLIVRVDPRRAPLKGDTIWVKIREGEQHLFSPATGARLPS